MTAPDAAATAAPPPAAGAPVWMRLLLVVSLAANLLVVGIVGGTLLARRGPDGMAMPRDMASAVYLRALPSAHRDAFEAGLRGAAAGLRIDREALRAEFAATLAVLRAEPFDAAALAERIAAQRARLTARTATGDTLFVERIAAMTPAERQAYAARLEQILRRGLRLRGD